MSNWVSELLKGNLFKKDDVDNTTVDEKFRKSAAENPFVKSHMENEAKEKVMTKTANVMALVEPSRRMAVESLTDENLAAVLTETNLRSDGMNVQLGWVEKYPEMFAEVKKNRNKAEDDLLKMIPKHTMSKTAALTSIWTVNKIDGKEAIVRLFDDLPKESNAADLCATLLSGVKAFSLGDDIRNDSFDSVVKGELGKVDKIDPIAGKNFSIYCKFEKSGGYWVSPDQIERVFKTDAGIVSIASLTFQAASRDVRQRILDAVAQGKPFAETKTHLESENPEMEFGQKDYDEAKKLLATKEVEQTFTGHPQKGDDIKQQIPAPYRNADEQNYTPNTKDFGEMPGAKDRPSPAYISKQLGKMDKQSKRVIDRGPQPHEENSDSCHCDPCLIESWGDIEEREPWLEDMCGFNDGDTVLDIDPETMLTLCNMDFDELPEYIKTAMRNHFPGSPGTHSSLTFNSKTKMDKQSAKIESVSPTGWYVTIKMDEGDDAEAIAGHLRGSAGGIEVRHLYDYLEVQLPGVGTNEKDVVNLVKSWLPKKEAPVQEVEASRVSKIDKQSEKNPPFPFDVNTEDGAFKFLTEYLPYNHAHGPTKKRSGWYEDMDGDEISPEELIQWAQNLRKEMDVPNSGLTNTLGFLNALEYEKTKRADILVSKIDVIAKGERAKIRQLKEKMEKSDSAAEIRDCAQAIDAIENRMDKEKDRREKRKEENAKKKEFSGNPAPMIARKLSKLDKKAEGEFFTFSCPKCGKEQTVEEWGLRDNYPTEPEPIDRKGDESFVECECGDLFPVHFDGSNWINSPESKKRANCEFAKRAEMGECVQCGHAYEAGNLDDSTNLAECPECVKNQESNEHEKMHMNHEELQPPDTQSRPLWAGKTQYISEDGHETRQPMEMGMAEDNQNSPDEVQWQGKKFKKQVLQ